jgi:two-component system chemotaxis response regulator CheB
MIRVGVVDDSPSIRSVLRELINQESDMRCVGSAADPYEAREMIKVARPDVLTLDIEMPRMNGLEFLERLMRLHPLPVIMISSLTERGSAAALEALSLGAVDIIGKPALEDGDAWERYAGHIVERIRMASRARLPAKISAAAEAVYVQGPAQTAAGVPVGRVRGAPGRPLGSKDPLVLIGASTGGTEALRKLLAALPAEFPPVLIVQHMPEAFTRHFAERLDTCGALRVREAATGDALQWGHALVAPGHSHLKIVQKGAQWQCVLDAAPKRNHHRPSVDVLYESALTLGQRVHAVLLTGMGRDGAQGMLALHEAGAHTVCQSEESCLVFGMPRAAIAIGAADEVIDLERVATHLIRKFA